MIPAIILKKHPLYSVANKKVLGKMKDECAGVPIKEFVGLRPKMYSILLDDEKSIRRAKGVKKNVINTQLSHECYKETLFDKKTRTNSMNMLRSEGHQIYGIQVIKITLSPFDSKRWIPANGVNTIAYGHYNLWSTI